MGGALRLLPTTPLVGTQIRRATKDPRATKDRRAIRAHRVPRLTRLDQDPSALLLRELPRNLDRAHLRKDRYCLIAYF